MSPYQGLKAKTDWLTEKISATSSSPYLSYYTDWATLGQKVRREFYLENIW
jgi:hypothetical protein